MDLWGATPFRLPLERLMCSLGMRSHSRSRVKPSVLINAVHVHNGIFKYRDEPGHWSRQIARYSFAIHLGHVNCEMSVFRGK